MNTSLYGVSFGAGGWEIWHRRFEHDMTPPVVWSRGPLDGEEDYTLRAPPPDVAAELRDRRLREYLSS